jgi:acyl carrier protein
MSPPHARSDEARWLHDWFAQRGPLPGGDEALGLNYFEAGLLDSLGVIDLISSIEERFGVRFDEHHFQERRFATIGGLSEIVAELRLNAARPG